MKAEVLAVGTELLLGPVVDTNSTWICERLAEIGCDVFRRGVVGDNHERIVEAMRDALTRCDVLIVTGGLGPTDDDITREAASEVAMSKLVLDEKCERAIRSYFGSRNYPMPESNLRQAMRPEIATPIANPCGTAPGLFVPIVNNLTDSSTDEPANTKPANTKAMFLLPGVPSEMRELMTTSVIGQLREMMADRNESSAVIVSKTLRCWGMSEAAIGEAVGPRIEEIDRNNEPVRIAFLAKGIEGTHVRVSVKTTDGKSADAILDKEVANLRSLLGECVFAVDCNIDDPATMESVVGELLVQRNMTLGVSESMTGGLIASRITATPGASRWFVGDVVSYASALKFSLLDVTATKVVSRDCAEQMANGARKVLNSDIGLSVTGVAGPTTQDDQPVGTVFCGIAITGFETEVLELHLSGNRQRIRDTAAMTLLNALRLRLRP